MKSTFVVALSLVFVSSFSQTKENDIFEKISPHKPPAIFLASMPPCIIGVANQYGTYLGVGENTIQKAKEFISEAHDRVPEFKKKTKQLEIAIMNASIEGRYDDYKELLQELSDLKIKASLFHEGLAKKARKVFSVDDIKKLDGFIIDNKEVFLKEYKL